ncbi:unnamed protein product [Ophioblennius macclurei]
MGRKKFRGRYRGSIPPNPHTTGLPPTTTAIIPIVIVVLFILFFCFCFFKCCRKIKHCLVLTPPPPTPSLLPLEPYPGGQYQHSYQPVPVQPDYPAQPSAYWSQPYVAGPPPTYQDAIGPTYPSQPMPYGQAAFGLGQAPYPQASVAPTALDFLSQPAYNLDFAALPQKTEKRTAEPLSSFRPVATSFKPGRTGNLHLDSR